MVSWVEFRNDIYYFFCGGEALSGTGLTGLGFEMGKFVFVACLFLHAVTKIPWILCLIEHKIENWLYFNSSTQSQPELQPLFSPEVFLPQMLKFLGLPLERISIKEEYRGMRYGSEPWHRFSTRRWADTGTCRGNVPWRCRAGGSCCVPASRCFLSTQRLLSQGKRLCIYLCLIWLKMQIRACWGMPVCAGGRERLLRSQHASVGNWSAKIVSFSPSQSKAMVSSTSPGFTDRS